MVNKENVELILDKLKNKGKVYLATDVEKYFFEMVDVFNKLQNVCIINKENFRLRPNLIVSTRYERKAIEKKNKAFFLVVKKNLD
jgi:tRNA G46 methylase TrmB